MSTVTNLIDHVEPRIGSYTDLLWAMNNAVRTIQKRLFVLRSDLAKKPGGYTVTIAKEDPYGDMPSDFWGLWGKPYENSKNYFLAPVPNPETILKYKPKTQDTNQGALTYPAATTFKDAGQDFDDWKNDGSTTTVYRLRVVNSDATESWGYIGDIVGADVTVITVYQDVDLATAGWNGTSPSGKTPSTYEVQSQTTGDPRYYELIGTRLYIYPVRSTEITLHGDYFYKPVELTDVTDTIPYSELFDDAIEEFLVKVVRSGKTGIDTKINQALFQSFLWDAVDRIVALRSEEAPKENVEGFIDWDSYSEYEL